MRNFHIWLIASLSLSFTAFNVPANAAFYDLVIGEKIVTIEGRDVKKLAVNNSIPGPTLRFQEGEHVTIRVTNRLNEDSSIHWHGLLLEPYMDGVPGLSNFDGIKPGESFTYKFKIRQSGTYWYHSHSGGQEQDGIYGAIVIEPKTTITQRAERDYVVLLSDMSAETPEEIIANLKISSDYYQYNRRTIGDFWRDVKEHGFIETWRNAAMWGKMRMMPTDLADVTGYRFLINGKAPEENWTGLFKAGESLRLRFINASASSFYDVRIPGLKLQIIAADGQNIEPILVDEFRFGVAETYDVIVTPRAAKAYSIVAEPIDRTGFALGTIAPREGMSGAAPEQRPRSLLTMADMGNDHNMAHMDHDMENTVSMGHEMADIDDDMETIMGMTHDMANAIANKIISSIGMDHNKADIDHNKADMDHGMDVTDRELSGWADAHTPLGHKALDYKDLRYLGTQSDTRAPERTIEVRLGGNMERYIWTLNGEKYDKSSAVNLKFGERVRLTFVNETMMAHPMHLHGMFVQLENGQPAGKLPNKHTVIVAPGSTYSVLLTADEIGEWAFHCHLLFHMEAGMMSKAVVAKLDMADMPSMTHDKAMTPMTIEPERALPLTAKSHGPIYHALEINTHYGAARDNEVTTWDATGWLGTDKHKIKLRAEGEKSDGTTETSDLWALYSRHVDTFWNMEFGFRHASRPDPSAYFVLGFSGLAPYFIETNAHLFVHEQGDISARIDMEKDLFITQRLILTPYVEGAAYSAADQNADTAAGLATIDLGLNLRYDITRKLSPYLDIAYKRKLGRTARLARQLNERTDDVVASVGLKLVF